MSIFNKVVKKMFPQRDIFDYSGKVRWDYMADSKRGGNFKVDRVRTTYLQEMIMKEGSKPGSFFIDFEQSTTKPKVYRYNEAGKTFSNNDFSRESILQAELKKAQSEVRRAKERVQAKIDEVKARKPSIKVATDLPPIPPSTGLPEWSGDWPERRKGLRKFDKGTYRPVRKARPVAPIPKPPRVPREGLRILTKGSYKPIRKVRELKHSEAAVETVQPTRKHGLRSYKETSPYRPARKVRAKALAEKAKPSEVKTPEIVKVVPRAAPKVNETTVAASQKSIERRSAPLDDIVKPKAIAKELVEPAPKHVAAKAGPILKPMRSDHSVSNKIFDKAVTAKGIFTKNKTILAAVAGVGAIAYLALSNDESARSTRSATQSLFSSLTSPNARRDEYISSSTLGMTDPSDILGRVYDPRMMDMQSDTYEQLRRSQGIMSMGDVIHQSIQAGMVNRGEATGSEVYVEDPTNKVFGYIDVMLPSGVPLELKTVSGGQLKKMMSPKEEHISQANFYALAKESQTALLMYISRDDPSQRKVFAVNADPGRYSRDIAAVRNVQASVQHLPSKNAFLSGFRPLNSWFGGGINYNMPMAHHSKIEGQRGRLSNLPVSQHMAQQVHYNHPNSSRAGVTG